MFQLRKAGLKNQGRAGLLSKNRRRLANPSALARLETSTVRINPKRTKSGKNA